jgi:carboxypeptidase T
VVERVSGADRAALAAAVRIRFFASSRTVVVADGLSFRQALVAGPLAASLAAALLYVEPDAVPASTRDAIRLVLPTAISVVGGPDSVSPIVLGELVGWSDGRLTMLPATPAYPSADSAYHDYNEMLTMIRAAEIAYPDLVHVFSIGRSYQGREIWAAKVSDNVVVDEDEPEVLVDALHHAGEHLGVEQALYLLKVLTTAYATDPTVRRLVDSREVYIIFALNPDGWAYDLTDGYYHAWRKNRQSNAPSAYVGTDLNRNYDYKWGCCGGSSWNTKDWSYRGPSAFSAPETQAFRDFVLSRVVGGKQQIRTHVTLHTNGLLILWPYGYTYTDVPPDMTADDHATFVAMGNAMAARNGYKAQQSSDLYITDGDQIDWMYARQHIFSFTFELYPTEQNVTMLNLYPPDEIIVPQTVRNRSALLYLIDMAACPYAAIGKAAQYCGSSRPGPTPAALGNL